MLSKACVVGAYQRKLEELAARDRVELMVVVPPFWQEESRRIQLEPLHTHGYRLAVEPIRFNGRFHVFHFPGLARRFREFRPDLVHVDEEPYNLAAWQAVRLAEQSGARSLFFTWQNIFRNYPPPFRWMEGYCFRNVDRAIAGNAEAADVLRRKGLRKPIDIIPQFGVDPEIFHPLDPYLLSGDAQGRGSTSHSLPGGRRSLFRIGYVGRLVEQKGILDLLQAAAWLSGDWEVTLAGAGPLQATIQVDAERLGGSDRVKILGGLPSQRMPEILNELDVLVLPSRTRPNWKEQFGRALVEAMACGVPVVGSDSGEIPNVIGDAGLVFPEGDVGQLRSHLESLRASPELRRRLAEKGRARVLARFTQAAVAEQTYQVYRRILGSMGAPQE